MPKYIVSLYNEAGTRFFLSNHCEQKFACIGNIICERRYSTKYILKNINKNLIEKGFYSMHIGALC